MTLDQGGACFQPRLFSLWQSCFGYPLSIFFIVVNEFCERFSYYGMRGNSSRHPSPPFPPPPTSPPHPQSVRSPSCLCHCSPPCHLLHYPLQKALLILYFQRFLGWNDNLGTAIYHTFVALCYLTPILGALIADSWLGKFK